MGAQALNQYNGHLKFASRRGGVYPLPRVGVKPPLHGAGCAKESMRPSFQQTRLRFTRLWRAGRSGNPGAAEQGWMPASAGMTEGAFVGA